MNINTKRKDKCVVEESCSTCGGSGCYNSSSGRSETTIGTDGKRYGYTNSESNSYGCTSCGGSGSFPTTKTYESSIFKGSAQSRYDSEFSKAITKGSGKVKVTYETFPCERCGKFHGERTSDGYWKGVISRSFSTGQPLECEGHTQIVEVKREAASKGWF